MEPKYALKLNIYYIYVFWMLFTVLEPSGMCAPEEKPIYQPKLMPSINEVVHCENDSYIVTCDGGGARVRWFSPNQTWIDPMNRGRVHVEEKNFESALIFTSITLDDKGNWTCEAEENPQRIGFNMIVYKPISFVDPQNVQSVKETEDVVIKCMVTGDPEPTITWYYNGQPLNIDGKKYQNLADGLLIKHVLKSDSGEYTCKAFQISSALSNVEEKTIRLNIQHKPVLPVRRESADIQYGYIDGYVNVTCEAEAEPAATFQWYRNKTRLDPKHYQITSGEHVSILQIHLNSSKEFGDYLCEANNTLGTLKRNILLINGTKPDAPMHITLRGVNSNTFDLDVGAKKIGSPSPMDIIGYRFELVSSEELRKNGGKWNATRVVLKDFTDGVTYLINNLSPNTTYWIRVASRNPAGLSNWMGPKEFRTHAKAGFEADTSMATQVITHGVVMHLTLQLILKAYEHCSPFQ